MPIIKKLFSKATDLQVIGFLLFLAIFTRFFHLTFYDIWSDEAFSVFNASSWRGLANPTDFFPGGYQHLLKVWISLFGYGLFPLRALSALISIACVFPLYRIGQMLFDRETAVVACLLFIFSPFQVWYAHEIRPYALIALESLLFFYFILCYIKHRRCAFIAGSLAVLAASFFTDYRLGLFLLFLVGIYSSEIKNKPYQFAVSIIFLLFSAVIAHVFISQIITLRDVGFWSPKPELISFIITFHNFLFGYIQWPSLNGIMLFFTGILLTLLVYPHDKKMFKLQLLVFVPAVFMFMFSRLFYSFYVDRFLIFTVPFFYLLLAASLNNLKRIPLVRILRVVLFSLAGFSLLLYWTGLNERRQKREMLERMHVGVPFKHRYANAAKLLSDNCGKDDYIIYTCTSTGFPLKYYLFKIFHKFTTIEEKLHVRMVCSSGSINGDFFEARELNWRVHNGFCLILENGLPQWDKRDVTYWLVSSDWERYGPIIPGSNRVMVREWMMRNCDIVKTKWINGILIEQFKRKD